MSKYIPGNQKHLTLDDRIYIQNELSKGTFYNAKNFCIHRYHCKKTMPVGKSFFAVLSMPNVTAITIMRMVLFLFVTIINPGLTS